MPTTVSVDWTAVVTIAGVVFAVAVAVATAVIGNRVLGSYNLRTRKYELFFEQKCAAFTAYIDYASHIWATKNFDLSIGPEFESLSRCAQLFANVDTSAAIAKLSLDIIIWAKASFKDEGAPNVIEAFSAVTELMQTELAEEPRNCRRKKK